MSGAFWGGFAAVLVGLGIAALVLRQRVLTLWRSFFGSMSLKTVVRLAGEQEEGPRSVSGLDQLLMPQILQDFPDFDVTQAKTQAKAYLRQQLSGHSGLRIHKVVISRYLTAQTQKTVVFQASLCWQEAGKTRQKRYDLHYAYLLPSEDPTVAANCPNCGATLGFGQTTCAYCGSRVVNVMGSTWQFTRLEET